MTGGSPARCQQVIVAFISKSPSRRLAHQGEAGRWSMFGQWIKVNFPTKVKTGSELKSDAAEEADG